MPDTEAAERFGNDFIAAAVERRVDDAEIVRRFLNRFQVDRLVQDVFKEYLIRLFPEDYDFPFVDGFPEVTADIAGEDIDLFHPFGNRGSFLRRKLGAVRPVNLVAVVLLGIVAGRDVQAGRSPVMNNRKAQLRRGPKGFKNPHKYAVGRHDAGRFPGEQLTVIAAVIRNRDPLLHGLFAFGFDHIRKSLGRMPDNMNVHIVQAGFHDAAQAGRAELQRRKEAVFDFLFVLRNGVQLIPFLFAEAWAVHPAAVFFHVISAHL